MNGLRDMLESVNDVALTGLKSGMEIGERNAALKAKPLIEALHLAMNTLGALGGPSARERDAAIEKARAALAAYAAYAREITS